MTSKRTQRKLAELGFQYDETVTDRHPIWGDWNGTIDPIGKMTVSGVGECSGHIVSGQTRAEMDKEAIEYAQSVTLEACNDPNCEMHT